MLVDIKNESILQELEKDWIEKYFRNKKQKAKLKSGWNEERIIFKDITNNGKIKIKERLIKKF